MAQARLASVIQKSVRWYSVAALLMAVTVIPVGFYFFYTHQHPGQTAAWRLPWCLDALMAVINFQLDPLLSFLEGCGYVPQIAHLRFKQSVTGSVSAWLALLSHHGFFAPAMMLCGTAAMSTIWLLGKRKLLFGLLRFPTGTNRIQWGQEVWPFQWRIAVSWFCGYFIFFLFNPVLFAFRGAVEAGQMGMSLSLANAIQNIAVAWVSTKSAPFGTLIAEGVPAPGSNILSGSLAVLCSRDSWSSDGVVGVCLPKCRAHRVCSTASRPDLDHHAADYHAYKCSDFRPGLLPARAQARSFLC